MFTFPHQSCSVQDVWDEGIVLNKNMIERKVRASLKGKQLHRGEKLKETLKVSAGSSM